MSIPFFSKLRSQKHYLQLVKPELKQVSEFVEAQSSCFDPEVADYMETVCQSKGWKTKLPCGTPLKTSEVVDYSAFQDNPFFAEALDKAIQVALEKKTVRRPARLWTSATF